MTIDRCSLSAETVDAYLHVQINMPVLADFDPRPALTLWTRKSDRRPHITRKRWSRNGSDQYLQMQSRHSKHLAVSRTIEVVKIKVTFDL